MKMSWTSINPGNLKKKYFPPERHSTLPKIILYRQDPVWNTHDDPLNKTRPSTTATVCIKTKFKAKSYVDGYKNSIHNIPGINTGQRIVIGATQRSPDRYSDFGFMLEQTLLERRLYRTRVPNLGDFFGMELPIRIDTDMYFTLMTGPECKSDYYNISRNIW